MPCVSTKHRHIYVCVCTYPYTCTHSKKDYIKVRKLHSNDVPLTTNVAFVGADTVPAPFRAKHSYVPLSSLVTLSISNTLLLLNAAMLFPSLVHRYDI